MLVPSTASSSMPSNAVSQVSDAVVHCSVLASTLASMSSKNSLSSPLVSSICSPLMVRVTRPAVSRSTMVVVVSAAGSTVVVVVLVCAGAAATAVVSSSWTSTTASSSTSGRSGTSTTPAVWAPATLAAARLPVRTSLPVADANSAVKVVSMGVLLEVSGEGPAPTLSSPRSCAAPVEAVSEMSVRPMDTNWCSSAAGSTGVPAYAAPWRSANSASSSGSVPGLSSLLRGVGVFISSR